MALRAFLPGAKTYARMAVPLSYVRPTPMQRLSDACVSGSANDSFEQYTHAPASSSMVVAACVSVSCTSVGLRETALVGEKAPRSVKASSTGHPASRISATQALTASLSLPPEPLPPARASTGEARAQVGASVVAGADGMQRARQAVRRAEVLPRHVAIPHGLGARVKGSNGARPARRAEQGIGRVRPVLRRADGHVDEAAAMLVADAPFDDPLLEVRAHERASEPHWLPPLQPDVLSPAAIARDHDFEFGDAKCLRHRRVARNLQQQALLGDARVAKGLFELPLDEIGVLARDLETRAV